MIKKCEKCMACSEYKERRSSNNRDASPWIVEINLLQGCLPLVPTLCVTSGLRRHPKEKLFLVTTFSLSML
jgi:hypothetical protein